MAETYVVLVFFFFRAEDGIRVFCLSRGLGDVYKGQDYPGISVVALAVLELTL